MQEPIDVNIPDELWDATEGDFFDFSLTDFMRTASDFDDEGRIHLFDLTHAPDAMTLYCTESDYMPDHPITRADPPRALHSSAWVALAG